MFLNYFTNMAVKIRLNRGGSTHKPHYGIVVINSTTARDGKFIEKIGHYHPLEAEDSKRYVLDSERLLHWISKGAQPTERVAKIALKAGVSSASKFIKPFTPKEKGVEKKKKS